MRSKFRIITRNGLDCLLFLILEIVKRSLLGNYYFLSTQLKNIIKTQNTSSISLYSTTISRNDSISSKPTLILNFGILYTQLWNYSKIIHCISKSWHVMVSSFCQLKKWHSALFWHILFYYRSPLTIAERGWLSFIESWEVLNTCQALTPSIFITTLQGRSWLSLFDRKRRQVYFRKVKWLDPGHTTSE